MHRTLTRGLAALFLLGALALAACGDTKPVATSATAIAVARTYPREANAALAALASSATGVAEVLARPGPSSAAWRSSLNGRLDALAQIDAQARALRPGAEDAEVHQRLLELTADFNRVAQLLRSSVEPVNPDGLTEAAQLLSAGVTRVAALRLALPQS